MRSTLEDFAAAAEGGDLAEARGHLRHLLLQRLTPLQFQKLGRLLRAREAAWREHLEGGVKRLAVVGTCTTRPLVELMLPHFVAEGWWVEIYEGDYGSFATEPLDPAAALYTFHPDYVLIATSVLTVAEWPEPGQSEQEVAALAGGVVAGLAARWKALRQHSKAQIIQHAFEPWPARAAGHREAAVPWSATAFVGQLNRRLWEEDGRAIRVLDVPQAAQQAGLPAWAGWRWHHHSKHGFDPSALWAYSLLWGGFLRALLGRQRKVLVCDLDNTLWGGVIGDDGLEGLELGPGSPRGEAFTALHRHLQILRGQGTLLAVCSKNDPSVAREPFEKHAGCLLRAGDFAAWECTWEPKSVGLARIAHALNVGLESLVFMDDNPAECAEVRQALPEVTVLQLEGDAADFIRQLDEPQLFTPSDFTGEDLARSASLAAGRELREVAASETDLRAYLASLAMSAEVRVPTEAELARVEQLFKKTNQFNWNGRTWSRPELAEQLRAPDAGLLAVWLQDRHASHGLVSCLVWQKEGGSLTILNWVMSCRVFSRGLEDLILRKLRNLATGHGCTTLRGPFTATPRNSYLAAFLERSRFQADGEARVLPLDLAGEVETFITLHEEA